MNVVPRTGGNRISGSVFFSGTGEGLQSDNYTEELRLAGLTAAIPLRKVYDLNGAVGGPIMRDRVWYFVNARTQGSTRGIASVYYNLNAGDGTRWLYSRTSRRAHGSAHRAEAGVRLTALRRGCSSTVHGFQAPTRVPCCLP
jgi:hypothetical protein